MVSFETLLDGLEVTVGRETAAAGRDRLRKARPLSGPAVPPAATPGRATLRLFAEWLIVTTPRIPPGHRVEPETGVVHFHALCLGSIGLFDELRRPLMVRVGASGPLRACAEALREESASPSPGARAMKEALVARCLILVLRRCLEDGLAVPWLPLMDDPGLARALVAMREEPAHDFTLAALAEIAGMSRSVFAERFAGALDVPPMEFLTRFRLDRAAGLLARSELPVKTVAARVGYRSRSSFTRAFTLRHGVGPAEFRGAASKAEPGVTMAGSRMPDASGAGARPSTLRAASF
jgi:AraC-like DNA-binding protein